MTLRSFRWCRHSIVGFCHSDSWWYTHFRFTVIFRLSSDWIWLHIYYDQILFVNASSSCSIHFSTTVDLCTRSWYCQGWRWPEGWSAQGQGCTSHLERSWTYYGQPGTFTTVIITVISYWCSHCGSSKAISWCRKIGGSSTISITWPERNCMMDPYVIGCIFFVGMSWYSRHGNIWCIQPHTIRIAGKGSVVVRKIYKIWMR